MTSKIDINKISFAPQIRKERVLKGDDTLRLEL